MAKSPCMHAGDTLLGAIKPDTGVSFAVGVSALSANSATLVVRIANVKTCSASIQVQCRCMLDGSSACSTARTSPT